MLPAKLFVHNTICQVNVQCIRCEYNITVRDHRSVEPYAANVVHTLNLLFV